MVENNGNRCPLKKHGTTINDCNGFLPAFFGSQKVLGAKNLHAIKYFGEKTCTSITGSNTLQLNYWESNRKLNYWEHNKPGIKLLGAKYVELY